MSKIDHIFGNAFWKDILLIVLLLFFLEVYLTINTLEVLIRRRAPFKVFNHLLNHPEFYNHLVNSWCTLAIFQGVGGI